MDNIYNSDDFFKTLYNNEKNTDSWCHKKGTRGIPPYVAQG